jgi:NADH-quinone oxidoreductase subunit L
MVGAETLTAVPDPAGALTQLWVIVAIPLAVAFVNLFVGRRLGAAAGWLATLAVGASAAISIAAVAALVALPAEERLAIQELGNWISVGAFRVGIDLRLDTLSATMILVITVIGSLIHLYSIGYMAEDPRRGRFFAYLNLFIAFMLILVLADNYVLLYLGWEGVGLCSFLLIGFWYERRENAEAAKKAFITTRIGDTFMLIGVALIAVTFGTTDFEIVFGSAAATITSGTATAIALLLFAGAIGKSAQAPLHVWLPDAMAGPTPVSALIHAATMVTAGVYLVIRSATIFELSPVALPIVLIVGLVTMLFAGLSAVAQWDIKRVLAYSTVSQLGYMFVAAGMRAYAVAMFFLVAHAFYKALMFLGAGSVIHGMRDEQDLRRMGGLRKLMPITFVTFLIGGLSQAGIPPLAGYFAKDAILEVANHTGRQAVYVLAGIGAFVTALYLGRMLILAFWGTPRSEEAEHAHESRWLMLLPLVILGAGAALVGLFNTTPEGLYARLVEPVLGEGPHGEGLPAITISAVATVTAILALALTWWVYGSGRVDWLALRERLEPLPRTALAGWYVDRAYDALVVQPGKQLSRLTAFVVDAKVVDGAVNAVGALTTRLASAARVIQNGFVRTYAFALFLGVVALVAWVGLR